MQDVQKAEKSFRSNCLSGRIIKKNNDIKKILEKNSLLTKTNSLKVLVGTASGCSKVAILTPKKFFRKSTLRNLLKRLARETFRKNANPNTKKDFLICFRKIPNKSELVHLANKLKNYRDND